MDKYCIQKHNCAPSDASTIALVALSEVGFLALNTFILRATNKMDVAPAAMYHLSNLALYLGFSSLSVDNIGQGKTMAIGLGSTYVFSIYKFGFEEGVLFTTSLIASLMPLMFVSETYPLFLGSSYCDYVCWRGPDSETDLAKELGVDSNLLKDADI